MDLYVTDTFNIKATKSFYGEDTALEIYSWTETIESSVFHKAKGKRQKKTTSNLFVVYYIVARLVLDYHYENSVIQSRRRRTVYCASDKLVSKHGPINP